MTSYHDNQVVLEGQWQEGYMAMAAVGATNIGSIEVQITFHDPYFLVVLLSHHMGD